MNLNAVIVLPTADELYTVTQYFERYVQKFGLTKVRMATESISVYTDDNDRDPYHVGVVSDAEMGNIDSAVSAAFVLGRFRPSLVISAGIAGSLNPREAWIGDVILPNVVDNLVINKIYASRDDIKEEEQDDVIEIKADGIHPARLKSRSWELKNQNTFNGLKFGMITEAVTRANRDFLRFNEVYTNAAQQISEMYPDFDATKSRAPRVKRGGRTFSWEKVQNSKELHNYFVSKKHVHKDAICVEMESWGFVRLTEKLSRISGHETLIVRAISDVVGAKHVTDRLMYEELDGTVGDQGLFRKNAMASLGAALGEIVRQHRTPELDAEP